MKKLQHVIREGLITKFVREGVIISEDVKDICEKVADAVAYEYGDIFCNVTLGKGIQEIVEGAVEQQAMEQQPLTWEQFVQIMTQQGVTPDMALETIAQSAESDAAVDQLINNVIQDKAAQFGQQLYASKQQAAQMQAMPQQAMQPQAMPQQ